MTSPNPNDAAASTASAVDAATRFISAIVWGEHTTVWELLSQTGREIVLEAGAQRGLDPMQAQRIRQGTCAHAELDSFLTGLLHGLRIDFSGVPLDEVEASPDVTALDHGRVDVALECPATFGDGRWSAGSLILSNDGNRWLIDRVNPLVSRSE